MKALIYSLTAVTALVAGNAYAACSYPTAPDALPDGNTATLEEMVAAQKSVKEFDSAITAYTACLKLENDSAIAKLDTSDPKKSEAQKKDLERMQIQKHNAAVEADEALAARFNEQLKTFKAKSKKS
jgi:hypothetical protein